MVRFGQNSDRFPPNILVIDAQSISVVVYGVDAMHAAAPDSYKIGSVSCFCVTYATTTSSATSQTVAFIIPAMIAPGTNCMYAILPAVAGASPQFFYGLLSGEVCNPVLPAWQLISWTVHVPDPVSPAAAASGLPTAAAAAIGVVIPLAVLSGVVVIWMRKRHGRASKPMSSIPVHSGNPMQAAADDAWTPNPVSGAPDGSSV
jgi:hypothetical protein